MKNKTLYLAKLHIRSEAVGGGELPDDEMQCDFVISNNEPDGHYSVMTEKTLRNYAAEANDGVPFMLEHSTDIQRQIGRTIAAKYNEEKKQVEATVSLLRDNDDTPDNMKVNEYIRRIERKFYDSCSVGFRDAHEICQLCGKDIWDYQAKDPCPHIPGRSYDGRKCLYDVDDGHLREVSLTSSPSNPNAKLLDRSAWSEELRSIKKEGDLGSGDAKTDLKTLLERDGEKYRQGLIDAAIKEGVRAEDNFNETEWRERFKSRESQEIIEQTATWKALGDARWGAGGRITETTQQRGTPIIQTEQPIILPNYVFEV